MKWMKVTALVTIGVSAEFEVKDDATKEKIAADAKIYVNEEINDVLGGIDFIDDDIHDIEITELN